ncbi:hypothetical protein [Dictyobacter arantiisoli]|nr:hypothetical protein [Dictyobacter arantiisoli]
MEALARIQPNAETLLEEILLVGDNPPSTHISGISVHYLEAKQSGIHYNTHMA